METSRENTRTAQGLRLIAYSIILLGGLLAKNDAASICATVLFLVDISGTDPRQLLAWGTPERKPPIEEIKEEE